VESAVVVCGLALALFTPLKPGESFDGNRIVPDSQAKLLSPVRSSGIGVRPRDAMGVGSLDSGHRHPV